MKADCPPIASFFGLYTIVWGSHTLQGRRQRVDRENRPGPQIRGRIPEFVKCFATSSQMFSLWVHLKLVTKAINFYTKVQISHHRVPCCLLIKLATLWKRHKGLTFSFAPNQTKALWWAAHTPLMFAPDKWTIYISKTCHLPLHYQMGVLENIPIYKEQCHPLSKAVNVKFCGMCDIHSGWKQSCTKEWMFFRHLLTSLVTRLLASVSWQLWWWYMPHGTSARKEQCL